MNNIMPIRYSVRDSVMEKVFDLLESLIIDFNKYNKSFNNNPCIAIKYTIWDVTSEKFIEYKIRNYIKINILTELSR